MLRPATLEDIPRIIELGQAFFCEAGLELFMSYCPESSAKTFAGMIESENAAIFLLTSGGEVVGGAGGILAPHYFNASHRTGQELFWYVDPAHRGRRESLRLLDALEAWAIGEGATTFVLASMQTSSPAVARLYQARGYHQLETYYMGRLPCPQ